MRRHLWWTFSLTLLVVDARGQPAKSPYEEVVLRPEQIPEHLVWKSVFEFFAQHPAEVAKLKKLFGDDPENTRQFPLFVSSDGSPVRTPDGNLQRLELSDAEFELIYREAAAHMKRDVACHLKLEAMASQLAAAGTKREDVTTALLEPRVECRQQVIDGRDRVLASLSPDGNANLQAWVYNQRQRMHVKWPVAELEFLKKPQ